ncbi:hypothetical protein MMC21_002842 [Puttea exsequens]|nr:hypothetical protein [Puttea exsequens]
MDYPRLALVMFLLLFLFFSPDAQAPSISQQRELDNSISNERTTLDVLNASNYGALDTQHNRWLNLTGLRHGDGYAWDALPRVKDRAKEQLRTILDGFSAARSFNNVSAGISASGNSLRKYSDEEVLSSMAPFGDPSPLYRNMSSIFHGKWVRSKTQEGIKPAALNLTELAPRVYYTSKAYDRNVTGNDGDLRVQVVDKVSTELPNPEVAKDVKALVTIKDGTSSGDGWEATLHGVHYPQQGGMILSTTSEKFAGIFALPHFALSKPAYDLAQRLLNTTLSDTIKKQDSDYTSVSNPWSSHPNNPNEAMFPVPHCEYVVYLQQHLIDDTSLNLGAIEQELQFPTGASMPPEPPIRMSALIFSPDCGFVLESKGPPDHSPQQGLHLNGQKQEAHLRDARRCILIFGSIICAQIALLMRQMKDASTPSTKSRIAFNTIAMMALGDGLAFTGSMVISLLVDAAFLPLIAIAFLSFLCVSFFGMKFLMDIWTVQGPERQEREMGRQRAIDRRHAEGNASRPATSSVGPAANWVPIITAGGADTLPPPVTASRPVVTRAPPIIITPDQNVDAADAEDNAALQNTPQTVVGSARREMSALYTKFYFLLLGILFLSLHATTWPTTLRSIYCNLLALIYFSLWLPQIHRNIIRNCRKALRWEFILGESALRLTPIIYFYTVPDNILFVDNDTNTAFVLLGWVWLQICVLISQEVVGPRFFVPQGWAPPAYDYHPIIREEDEESGATMPIGFTQATADPSSPTTPRPGESKGKGRKMWDCAICTENIEVAVLPAIRSGSVENSTSVAATTLFSRRMYMVTPCRHIFHSQCLEGWMRYRLQCPICRENLPPL